MRGILLLGACMFAAMSVNARTVKGLIKDAQTGEEIIGASVLIKEKRAYNRNEFYRNRPGRKF